MKKLLFDLKEELKNKYNYEEDFAQTISLVTESVVNYFGEDYEDVVIDAVKSCHYSINDTPTRNILGYSNTEGEFTSIPTIKFKDGKYKVTKIEKNITLPNTFNLDNPASIGLLTNKTIALVRSHLNEYKIEDDILEQRQGLMKKTYKLKNKSGVVNLTNPIKVGEGLEDGIISYDELYIMRSDFDDNYELSKGNDYQRIIAGYLEDNLSLKSTLIEASLTGNIEDLTKSLGSYDISLEAFLTKIDELVSLESIRIKSTLDADKLKESTDKLVEYYEKELAPEIQLMTVSLNPELAENYSVNNIQ